MKYAKKISLPFSMLEMTKNRMMRDHPTHSGEYGVSREYSKARVIRQYLPKKYIDPIKSKLPIPLQPLLSYASFSEIRLLAPHIHLEEKCIINCYLKTNGEVTKFYEGDFVRDDSNSLDNGNGYINVDINKIYEVESFTAKEGDVWILSTEQPHSLSFNNNKTGISSYIPDNDDYRLVIQLVFDADFDFVASHFEEIE